ncbi:Prefoldin [Leucosporidium creatinivorum]|uniref:Prefoldin n=1 Tax=Leucosporidium creatinivorum TaxID=106004 RepID=A0A1Y2F5W5_9BASI|nr:Prefoldin [Leucosporidium creatinivorum]
MSAPVIDEGMQKVLMQLQAQYQDAARQLQIVRAQHNARQRDAKLNTLTLREIEALPTDPPVTCYKGVGRMFVQEPRKSVEDGLKSKAKESSAEVAALEKKMKYLEGEMATAQGSLRDVLKNAQ